MNIKERRDYSIDMTKGVLICLVVLGHSGLGILHDIIFLFHMPLFFVLSGLFIRKEKCSRYYIRKRATSLMIPYLAYGLTDCLICKHSVHSVQNLIWGGRYINGVYWYATCFLFSLTLLCFLQSLVNRFRRFSDRWCKILIILGGMIAVIESNFLSGKLGEVVIEILPRTQTVTELLKSPGIPWNLDVALLALIYLAVGYYNRDRIYKLMNSDNKKLDGIACVLAVTLTAFCCFNYRTGEALYYFDMKPVYYHELFSAIMIPCMFGFVLVRLVRALNKVNMLSWLRNGLAFLGRTTIPIMFMHVPLNTWRESLGYGRAGYVLIGIGVPVVFTVLFSRFKVMRTLFGLPGGGFIFYEE